jgi:hypothetical protein
MAPKVLKYHNACHTLPSPAEIHFRCDESSSASILTSEGGLEQAIVGEEYV